MTELLEFKLNNKAIVEIFKLNYSKLHENIDDSSFGCGRSVSVYEAKYIGLGNDYNNPFAKSIVNKIEELKDKYGFMFPDKVVKIYHMCSIMSCGCDCRHIEKFEKIDKKCRCCIRHNKKGDCRFNSFDSFKDYLNS